MKYMLILLILFNLMSCETGCEQNLSDTVDWIANHPRPIKVTEVSHYGMSAEYSRYMLVDSKSNIYVTGVLEYTELPEIIE